MTKPRNQFTTEFKQECVHLVLNQGYRIAQAAKSMNVGLSSLQRWLRQYRQEVKGITLEAHAISPEQQRIQALEAQIKQLKRDNDLLKKLIRLLRHRNASQQHIVAVKLKKAGFKVTEACKQLSMDRSRYYRKFVQKPIDVETVKLKAVVRQIHGEMHATYGSRRMRAELNAQGFVIGRYKVRSLMQALSLKAKRPKQHRYPVAGKPSAVAPNALNRQFNPPMAHVNWTGDITYIRTSQGWLYLAIVLDLYSRRVVSWAFSNQPNSELSVRALEVAVQHRRPSQAVLFHSDQGVQYSSDTFRDVLSKHNITASMSRRGNCHDNAVTERFFRILKSERVNYRQYKTRDEAMKDIADYIEPFYNQRRRHSTLGNLSPAEYEQKYQQKTLASVADC